MMRRFARFKSGGSLNKICHDITGALFATLLIAEPIWTDAQPIQTLTIMEYRPHLNSDQPTVLGMMKFAELVSEESNGRLAVTVSGETVLLDGRTAEPAMSHVQNARLRRRTAR